MSPAPTAPPPAAPVLVTGGAGFIGSHLVEALVARGCRVRVLDDLSTGRRQNLAPRAAAIELIEGDIRSLEDCRRACQGVGLVFHLAARGSVPRSLADPATTVAVNVAGTANLFAAAREAGARRVVYASSSSVYGDSPTLPRREGSEGEPLSPYAASKAICERLAATYGRCYGQELVGLRYFNVYGPRQDPEGPYAAVIPRFFRACLAGAAPVIFGDGEQTRDFTFVGDAVRATLAAAAAPAAVCGRAVNVARGQPTSINELAEAVRELAGGAAAEHRAPRPGDVRHSHADLGLARTLLAWEPSVALGEGLRRSLEHYRSAASAGAG